MSDAARPAVPDGATAFEVDPAALIGAAGTMDAEADALAVAAQRLQLHLAAVGPAWGDDEVGARFGAGYQPVAERVLGNVGALAAGLVRIGAALRAVATSYDLVDQAVAAPPPTPTPGDNPRPRPADPLPPSRVETPHPSPSPSPAPRPADPSPPLVVPPRRSPGWRDDSPLHVRTAIP